MSLAREHTTARPRALWPLAMLTAVCLAATAYVPTAWAPLRVLDKGTTAPHTVRARQDAVYDLHETFAEEAREAKQNYVPIYNKDNELIYDQRNKILAAVRDAPLSRWAWPDPAPGPDAGALAHAGPADVGPVDAGPADALAAGEVRQPDTRTSTRADARAADRGRAADRKREIEALARGFFQLLIPLYREGVVGDGEFPAEKKTIRVFADERYVERTSRQLHRFSELRPTVEKRGADLFFSSERRIREQVLEFILQRLPPNVTYAKENEKFIKDISQVTGVKVVLIRRGEVLVRRGDVVDTRAYYAVRAAAAAAMASSELGAHGARLGLLAALLLLLAGQDVVPRVFRAAKPHAVLWVGMVLLAVGGQVLLLYTPLHPVALPGAALAAVMAVTLGRGAGLLTAVAVPCALALTQLFDVSTLLVGVAGGLTGALGVRRRRRSSALAAGVLVGVVQALAFEAARAVEGRPRTYAELWAAAGAFGSGLAAGVIAVVVLPFVEWLLGLSSRGKLKVLTDFDHPLVRDLRERAPGTFAHTVNLINMVELAADAVGADRLLARAGTLFHDVGKMKAPAYFIENQGQGPNIHDEISPAESAAAIVAHVPDGLAIARKHHLPPDVAAFIPEHHGTTGLEFFMAKARERGEEPDPALYHYPGPKPHSVESAILMIADSVEAASKTIKEPTEQALGELVDRIVVKKFSEFQFDECGLTQWHLRKIKGAFVGYLGGALHRRVEYPGQRGDSARDEEAPDRGQER